MPTRRHVISFASAAGAFAALSIMAGIFSERRQTGTTQTGLAQNASKVRLRAVATFSILGDFVGNVGGERVQLTTLVGPNGDVHVYAPAPGDVKTVALSGIVFVNGLGLEGWLDRLIAASATRAPVVVTSRGIVPRDGLRAQDYGARDPHAWQSVVNAKIYVGNIRDGLIAADPHGEKTYEANATVYLAKLDELDAEIKAAIESVPTARRKAVTAHDAFGYFGDAYGVEFIAPEGLSTEAEPSAGGVARLIDQIRRQKIPAVFMENITDPHLAQRIAEETGAKIGGTLYSDALSSPNGPSATYIDMMRSNLRELTSALAC